MRLDSRIYVAGHRGLVGSTLMRRLHAGGCMHIITRTHAPGRMPKCGERRVSQEQFGMAYEHTGRVSTAHHEK